MKTQKFAVPPADPLSNYFAHREEIDSAVQLALANGRYIRGPETYAFEEEFAKYLGASNVVGVGSGTDALAIALRTLGIGSGDKVISVSHTAVATIAAIEMVGAEPILVDVDKNSYIISIESLERTISKHSSENLRAIIPVHLYGYPIDMEIIIALAHDKHLFVIEDCAQAHGAMVNGKKVGTFGDIAAFSFYPTKNLGAIGDGGALASCQSGLIEKSRLLSEYGWKERYISEYSGLNSRLDEIQAAILRVKLRWLDQENNRRREIAAQYINGLSQLPDLQLPETYNKDHVFHQFVVRSRDREKLRQWMFERGVGTLIHYPVPVHKQPAYRNRLLCDPKGLKITEHLCDEILSLPMYPQMSNSQVEQVIEVIQSFFQKSL